MGGAIWIAFSRARCNGDKLFFLLSFAVHYFGVPWVAVSWFKPMLTFSLYFPRKKFLGIIIVADSIMVGLDAHKAYSSLVVFPFFISRIVLGSLILETTSVCRTRRGQSLQIIVKVGHNHLSLYKHMLACLFWYNRLPPCGFPVNALLITGAAYILARWTSPDLIRVSDPDSAISSVYVQPGSGSRSSCFMGLQIGRVDWQCVLKRRLLLSVL